MVFLPFKELAFYNLTQTVVDCSYARLLSAFGKPIAVHIGIDTGMHRLGKRSDNLEEICRIWEMENLNITGVYSHLCAADGNSPRERAFTLQQIEAFDSLVKALGEWGITGFKTHIQGSYGVLNYPGLHYDYARVGLALYGVLSSPKDTVAAPVSLKPVLSLKSRMECIRTIHKGESVGYGLTYTADRERKIAAVSIGYADGIPRELSNQGYALVNGKRVPIIGRICMDQLLIDITELSEVSLKDEVVFIGKSVDEEITASDFAENAHTISNEILSRLGNRLERVIVE